MKKSANLDLVRSLYAAWERGDFSSVEWAHPEIEYVQADGPSPGRWTELAGMAEGFRDWLSAWEDYRVQAEEPRARRRARGSWGTEWHDVETTASEFKLPGNNGVYEIPLGALTSIDTPNLFAAGRTADGDQMAGASLRVMGTAFATGQACGVGAAEYAHAGAAAVPPIQRALRTQGALIDGDDLPEPVALPMP